jgi:hypothetical protein
MKREIYNWKSILALDNKEIMMLPKSCIVEIKRRWDRLMDSLEPDRVYREFNRVNYEMDRDDKRYMRHFLNGTSYY